MKSAYSEDGRRKFQIALTFMFFGLLEIPGPIWNQREKPRRMVVVPLFLRISDFPMVSHFTARVNFSSIIPDLIVYIYAFCSTNV